MNKKPATFTAAIVYAVLCLALIFCVTSCFNLSSNQRGTFSFTIDEAVTRQLENAMGSSTRTARNASKTPVTATVTLNSTSGSQLVDPVSKTGTIQSLTGETITIENIPLHVPFTVSISFTAYGKEIFAGTSASITLTSKDATPVAIALKHILDTDYVLPYWDSEYDFEGSFRFSQTDSLATFDIESDEAWSQYCGYEETCFDAYGNIWSIDAFCPGNGDFLESCLTLSGNYDMDFDESDPFSLFKQGNYRAVIPNAYYIECDYTTNELYIVYADIETEDLAIIKLSVDELLSIDTDKEVIVPSFINSPELSELWDEGSLTALQNEFTFHYVEPLVCGEKALFSLLYSQPHEGVENELCIEDPMFAVNNGTVYITYLVSDIEVDSSGEIISEDFIGYFLAAIDPVTRTCQTNKIDFNSIFGANIDLSDIHINDILGFDGKLYILAAHGFSNGALIEFNPNTLNILRTAGVASDSDIYKSHEPSSSGYWFYKTNDYILHITDECSGSYLIDDTKYTLSPYCLLIQKASAVNKFAFPVKFVAIKPKKLVIADTSYFYIDDENIPPKNRLLTVDLTNFSIETTSVPDSFFLADDEGLFPASSEELPFTIGDIFYTQYSDNDPFALIISEENIGDLYFVK